LNDYRRFIIGLQYKLAALATTVMRTERNTTIFVSYATLLPTTFLAQEKPHEEV